MILQSVSWIGWRTVTDKTTLPDIFVKKKKDNWLFTGREREKERERVLVE